MHSDSAVAARSAVKRRVFLVDDHPVFRFGLSQLINHEPDLVVCGEASSAAEALGGLRNQAADVAVLDVSLPGANGLELIKQVRAESPDLPILILSMHAEDQYALRALRAGATGYLMKKEALGHFLEALRKTLAGEVYVSAAFGEQLIFRVSQGRHAPGSSPVDALTDRELEVLQLVGEARSSRAIAESLHLSVKTVESHRLHIKEKLGLKSSGELVRFALDWVAQAASHS